ncbi:MAG: hypothetical protein RR253_06870, partial [Oscillospiraceae bacterium]
ATIEEINTAESSPTISAIPNKPTSVSVSVPSASLMDRKPYGITIIANYEGKRVAARYYSFVYTAENLSFTMDPPRIG